MSYLHILESVCRTWFSTFTVVYRSMVDFCEVTLYSEDLLMYLLFFFPRLLKLLCRQLHYVWIVKFSFFLSIWYVFYFCLLPVALNKTCWYWKRLVRVDILVLFPVLEIEYSAYIIKYNISYRFFVDTFYQVDKVLL